MPIEKSDKSGEHEPIKPVWRELIEIEKELGSLSKRIDASGADFLAGKEILDEHRRKTGWYEKWAFLTLDEIRSWAEESYKNEKEKQKRNLDFYIDEGSKNQKTALEKIGATKTKVENTLYGIANATLEDSAQELEKIILSMQKNSLRETANIFLTWLKEFKKEIIYNYNLDEQERSYFDSYGETIESNLDDLNLLNKLLLGYMKKLAEILRENKSVL